MRRALTVWLALTMRPRRISLTSTVTADVGLPRGDTRRARSARSLAMSERSSWKRFGLDASGRRHAAHARGEHVELCGDVLEVHGCLSGVGAVTYAEFPSGVA